MPDSAWLNEADALAQLDRLDGPHVQKKRDTILALIDARLSGASEETVWKLPNTCSRNIYHAKWKKDPVFADVLTKLTASARNWKDTETIRALQEAARRMALAAPVAVIRLIERLNSADEAIIVRAAVALLDRAGIETAVKASQQTRTWQDDVIDLLRKGEVEADDVIAEFGPEQATELIAAAGLWRGEGGEAEGEGGT